MMWENKQHPNVLYIDNRPETNPMELQDFRKLPYPDKTFKLIVFDPPHKIRKKSDTSRLAHDYGVLEPETWQSDLTKGFNELWRCLKDDGILIFKWGETQVKYKDILSLFPVKPLIRQKSAGSTSRQSKPCGTYWFCFMKIPNGEASL